MGCVFIKFFHLKSNSLQGLFFLGKKGWTIIGNRSKDQGLNERICWLFRSGIIKCLCQDKDLIPNPPSAACAIQMTMKNGKKNSY